MQSQDQSPLNSQSAPHGADSRSNPYARAHAVDQASESRQSAAGDADRTSLSEDIGSLKDHAKEAWSGSVESAAALRRLALAELNLSRHAAGRSVAWVAVCAVFGASAWLLLMAAGVVAAQGLLDISWMAAMLGFALISLVVTAYAAWRVRRYFAYTGFKSTKTELARFGLGDPEDSDYKPGFEALQRRVDRAEIVAEGRRQQWQEAVAAAKAQAKSTVTPARVLGAGVVSGYLIGRRNGVKGRVQRTGFVANRSAFYTTDAAMRGLSEVARLAFTAFAALKTKEAADQAEVAATEADHAASAADNVAQATQEAVGSVQMDGARHSSVKEPARDVAWDPEDPSAFNRSI